MKNKLILVSWRIPCCKAESAEITVFVIDHTAAQSSERHIVG